MSRYTTTAPGDLELIPDAELAAKGDDSALDRLFAALGGSSWGIGFASADAVGPATDAVAHGFSELLQLFDNGIDVTDLRAELLRATRAAALSSVSSTEAKHAREPLTLLGETKDRQATLAFTALSEPMRCALWLTETEDFSVTKTSRLLGLSHKDTEELTRMARANFRSYYVDAVRRDGMSDTCVATLDKLAAYVGRSLPAGDVAAVEHHLAECKECRAIVMKLDDLEGRLHAAIPPLPAWTRQQVADTWSSYVPLVVTAPIEAEEKSHEKRRPVGAFVGLGFVAAALIAVLAGSGVFDSSSNSSKTQIAASDNNAVNTPKFAATTTTVAPATSTTAAPATTSTTAAPVVSPTTARPRVTTTTNAAPKATTTTTPQTGYTLVNLPPSPIQ